MDLGAITRFALLLVRPGMLVLATPPLGGAFAPPYVKIGLTVILAAMAAAAVPVPAPPGTVGIGVIAAREAAIGLALAFGVRVLIGAAELGGYLSGFQIGFSFASVADPQTGVRNNVLSTLYGLVAVIVFFAVDAHHDLLRALVQSYDVLPVGHGGLDGSLAGIVARLLGLVFTLGVQMAAPVLVVLLVAELALGLLSRAAPSLNLLAQGYPLRLVAGLLTLALTFRAIPVAVESGIPKVLETGALLASVFR